MKRIMSLFDASMLRFALVGALNTLFGAGVMFALYNLAGASYWLSSAMNYLLGSILSYFLNKHFTFRNKEKSLAQIWRFALNIAACYLIAYGLAKPAALWLLVDASLKIQENVAMAVGLVIFTGLNYFGQRFFAFKSESQS